jgi:sterol desaturase/sphingolipid hydroxylase (fatty acid hydroxylase superfamily)
VSAIVTALALKIALAYLALAAFVCLLVAAEMAFPREPLMSREDRIRVVVFALISIPVIYLCSTLALRLMASFGVRPLFPGTGPLHILVAVLLGDFGYYWYHRAQHAIPLLWKIHAVHHSPEKMGAGAGFHHVLDAPLRVALLLLPATWLIGGSGSAEVSFLLTLHGFYVHSTTRANFGRFAWIVCDNRAHRVHHSRDADHFNRNFGVVTLAWDRLFGTAHIPKAGEWPRIGLDEMPEPKSIAVFLWPWKRQTTITSARASPPTR